MDASRRQRLADLSLRDFCLYRAICIELEDLQDTIQLEGLLGRDFHVLSVAMRDRRLLVEWLRDLLCRPPRSTPMAASARRPKRSCWLTRWSDSGLSDR